MVADARKPYIARGRIRSAMLHAFVHFDSGWETVEQQPTYLGFQGGGEDFDQFLVARAIKNGAGELAIEAWEH